MNQITNKNLSLGARVVYMYLIRNKDNKNEVRERGTRLIAEELGTSYQSIIRYLAELEKENLISRTTINQNEPQIIEII